MKTSTNDHNARTSNRTQITIEQLKQGTKFSIENFVLNNEGLFLNKKDKETGEKAIFKVCEPLFILQTVQNLDTKDVHLDLCYKFKGKFVQIPIGMGQLIPNELLKLMAKGVDIPHEQVKVVATYLREQQKKSPHKVIYHQVGWHKEESNLVFRHHELIALDSNLKANNDHENGSYYLKPTGDLEKWKKMIQDEVLGQASLETILAVGFSSALVGYLSHYFDDVDTMIFHLAGKTTQGKTTAGLLAVSVFGLPSSKKKGLMKNWNGTKNAILNMLGGNLGIPIVLDELSMTESKSLTDSIYVLASGQEKARLTDTIQLRKQGRWSLTIISTGELSIFEKTNQNAGLTIRTFEHANVQWTKSAQNADRIRGVIQHNYGHAGETFARFLVDAGLETIEQTWLKWQQRCEESFQDSVFRTRISKKYAIVLAAADFANQAMDLSLDTEAILQFLVEQEEGMNSKRETGKNAWDLFIAHIIEHQSNFKIEGVQFHPHIFWGKIFPKEGYMEVAFLKHVLIKQLKELQFDNPKAVLTDWKDDGLLLTESDRPTKRTKLFNEEEQQQRQQALGKNPPRKVEDTTYNLKVPNEMLKDLLRQDFPGHRPHSK